jgi:hypothetical protein
MESKELTKLRREREKYYNGVNKELTFIRDWMLPILEERADKYSNPLILLKYAFQKDGIYRVNNLKDKIHATENCFKERYEILRDIYRARFNHFPREKLLNKYENMVHRREDLKKRLSKVENMSKSASILKKKRVKNLSTDISEEIKRRQRAIDDVLVEFKRRNISLEHEYGQ